MARRVSADELVACQGRQQNIRNVCILAHVDHGKTTLSDSLVSSNGIISAKLAGKLRFLDSTEEEQQRGITMKSSAISLLHTKEIRQRPGTTPPTVADPALQESLVAAAAPPPPPASTPVAAEGTVPSMPSSASLPPSSSQDFLINLIDSPGHIDFSSDVSTATRLSDGAIVVVDVLEGVCTQTHAVLRQAWSEGMKPCLVLNKLDRLILEVRLTPLEAYWHLQRVLEQVNAISSSLITSETFKLDETEAFTDNWEKEWLFAPERGNVVFASSLYCWAFSIPTFARIWMRKLGVKPGLLAQHLWGDFVFNVKTLAVSRYTPESKAKPMFVAMILDPIWQIYEATVLEEDLQKVGKMVKRLDLEVPPRELNPKDLRGTASAVFRRWLPLAQAVLDMVVDTVPDPVHAQCRRIGALWPPMPLPDAAFSGGEQSDSDKIEAYAAGGEALERVRKCVAQCSVQDDAPIVAFVSKVVPVRAVELGEWCATSAYSGGDRDGDVFVAFARVFSGILRPDSDLFVLGPKYHPQRKTTRSHVQALSGEGTLGLFMMMGTSMLPVPCVPAGNLVAIAGLEGLVVKSATLSSTLACPALRAMTLQAKPIVRVAVEVVRQGDMEALERGLAKLYQADPAVEISVQENGEHVITALGELHLEQCLKDLRDRYSRVEIRASTPLVAFRESVAFESTSPEQIDRPPQLSLPPWSEEEGVAMSAGGVCKIITSSGDCRLTIRCLALPTSLAQLIDTEPFEMRKVVLRMKQGKAAQEGTVDEDNEDVPAAMRRMSVVNNESCDLVDNKEIFRQKLEDCLRQEWKGKRRDDTYEPAEMNDGWTGLSAGMDAVLAFGPRNVGPNMLWKAPGFVFSVLWAAGGGLEENEAEADVDLVDETRVQEWKNSFAWPSLENSILVGFQMATASGPLAEEQMYGVAFAVEEVALLLKREEFCARGGEEVGEEQEQKGEQKQDGQEQEGQKREQRQDQGGKVAIPLLTCEDLDIWLSVRLGSITGQVMSSCKSACRAAFLSSPVRLVEALFECDLQCDRMQLGKLYGVLSRRRGRVVEEDIIEGTNLFIVKALLPVAESFGFATELLKKTSGAATSPQLAFSHWERMEMNPFWRPQNEEDREEFGETMTCESNVARKYIDDTRRRKGLQIGDKIVVHAEKQRTLSRKK